MDHPYGLWSLLPPVVAIVLAIFTRRAALSLFFGVVVGALILAKGNPFQAVPQLLETHLWATLAHDSRLRVFAFTLLMGAMVGVVSRCGGMRGLVDTITPLASNRRRGQLTTWALGLIVFFDDYANTMLLGSTLRPLCDRLRISRAKLAYLVDSTSAPVAGLALISTWVAGEISYVQDGLNNAAAGGSTIDAQPFALFVSSIPYRFYVLWALLMVPLVAILGRDFAPMWRAERDALTGKDESKSQIFFNHEQDIQASHWLFAVVPVLATVAAIVALMWTTGRARILAGDEEATPSLMEIFGDADPYGSLLWGSLAGLLVAVSLSLTARLLSVKATIEAASRGAVQMLPALLILWLASSLSTMTGGDPNAVDKRDRDIAVQVAAAQGEEPAPLPAHAYKNYRLYTGDYLSESIGDELPAWLLPTLIFILSAGVAFATGTSWGTMGIVMPMAIPLATGVLQSGNAVIDPESPLLLCTIGSVLAGAIFGDHCSPISDTTVLSSQASGCDHIAHVWTQLPYALLVGGIAILFGTLPIGLGMNVWLLLPIGTAAMVMALLLLGRRVE